MKNKKLIILALVLSLPACSLLAQNDGPPPGGQFDGPPGGGPGGPGGPGRGRRPMMPLIAALDVNKDGVISADEIANAAAALKTLDKNGDGQLTMDEYQPMRPNRGERGGPNGQQPPPPRNDQNQAGPPKRPLPPILAALDADGDGIISAVEIANAPAALLKLDKNGDGKLTMDELMGPRPQRPDGNGGPDGNRPPPPDDFGPGSPDGQQPPPPVQN